MFKISKDHLYKPGDREKYGMRDETGVYFITGKGRGPTKEEIKAFDEKKHVQFRIKDGDGILYYTGLMPAEQVDVVDEAEDIFEPLDWARANAGATTLEIKEGGAWKEV